MTDPNEPSLRRVVGILCAGTGLTYIWFDFARAEDATYSGWQQLPFLAVLGGVMISLGAIQIYWRVLPKFLALGWFYLFFGSGYLLTAAIEWEPAQSTISLKMFIGILFIVAAISMFKQHVTVIRKSAN